MIGCVDDAGRAIVSVTMATDKPEGVAVDIWIDTGFTGDLVIPRSMIDQLALKQSGSVDAILADGAQLELATYSCKILWFGRERTVEAIANEGDVPLLGIGLLLGKELRIDYTNLTLSLEPSSRIAP